MCANDLKLKVKEYRELKAMLDELEDEISRIENEIKAEMTARDADELTVDTYKVRWTRVTSSRFDTSAFKKAMPELAKQFMKSTESRRFSIA